MASAIVPGSGLALMGLRSFGSGAQQARQAGATEDQQFFYGAANAAVEVLSEKLFGGIISGEEGLIAKGLTATKGGKALVSALRGSKGAALVGSVVSKLNQTGAGAAAVKALQNFSGEAFEEAFADAVNPLISAIYNGKTVAQNYADFDEADWQNMLTDALAGGILGMVGGGISDARSSTAQTAQNTPPDAAAPRTAQEQGDFTSQTQNGAQGVYLANDGTAQQAQDGVVTPEQLGKILFGDKNTDEPKRTAIDTYGVKAGEAFRKAESSQKKVDTLVESIAHKTGAIAFGGTQKSVESIASRMQRNSESGRGNSAYDLKDLARSHIEMRSWDDVQNVLASLDEMKIPYTVDAKATPQGYRGLHVIYKDGDVGVEIQLTTPEAWAVKMETEKIYAKWRDFTDITKLSQSQLAERAADFERSLNMWSQLSPTLPDFATISASSGVNARESSSNKSPAESGLRSGPHDPLENSKHSVPVSRIMRPDGLTNVTSIDNPPSHNSGISISDNESNVNRGNDGSGGVPNATGAAAAGFDQFTHMENQYGVQKSGANPVRSDDVPVSTGGEDRVSHVVVNLKGAEITPDDFVPLLENETVQDGFSYIPISNDETIQQAEAAIMRDGWNESLANWKAAVFIIA